MPRITIELRSITDPFIIPQPEIHIIVPSRLTSLQFREILTKETKNCLSKHIIKRGTTDYILISRNHFLSIECGDYYYDMTFTGGRARLLDIVKHVTIQNEANDKIEQLFPTIFNIKEITDPFESNTLIKSYSYTPKLIGHILKTDTDTNTNTNTDTNYDQIVKIVTVLEGPVIHYGTKIHHADPTQSDFIIKDHLTGDQLEYTFSKIIEYKEDKFNITITNEVKLQKDKMYDFNIENTKMNNYNNTSDYYYGDLHLVINLND